MWGQCGSYHPPATRHAKIEHTSHQITPPRTTTASNDINAPALAKTEEGAQLQNHTTHQYYRRNGTYSGWAEPTIWPCHVDIESLVTSPNASSPPTHPFTLHSAEPSQTEWPPTTRRCIRVADEGHDVARGRHPKTPTPDAPPPKHITDQLCDSQRPAPLTRCSAPG